MGAKSHSAWIESIPLPEPAAAPDDLGSVAREFLDRAREGLKNRHFAGASGREIVEGHTRAMDRIVGFLHDAGVERYSRRNPSVHRPLAVLAQGGYGRGELNPYSDIDLLFLYGWKVTAFVETVTETILYALWDTGLKVGHALRSLRDCSRLAATDFKVRTALIETRHLCGDEGLDASFEALREKEILRKSVDRFVRQLVDENEQRHEAYGGSIYLQQPDVKESAGGLRDLQTAYWLASVKYKIRNFPELVQKGVIARAELEAMEAARDFLWRVRNTLHYLAGRASDQITFEVQEDAAACLGYMPDDERQPAERFLRDYYLAAETASQFLRTIRERVLDRRTPYRRFGRILGRQVRPGVLVLHSRELAIEAPEILEEDPSNIVSVFVDAQAQRVPLGPRARDLLREAAPILGANRSDPRVIAAFFRILRSRHGVHRTLREMYDLGVLGEILPEFEQLRCMVIRDLYHIYTVDEHTLRGVQELERLAQGRYRMMVPLLTQVMHEVERRDLLYLAILLHDIGKGHGHAHSERGARRARDVTDRLGLSSDEAHDVELLVRHHLLMSHIAQNRDIEDERLVIQFAQTVETVETLRMLYPMTFADMRSVAPKVWTNWRDHLLGQLYRRTLDVFDRGEFVEEERQSRIDRIRGRLVEELEELGEDRARELRPALERLPSAYFLSASRQDFVNHLELLTAFGAADDVVAWNVRHFEDRDFSEVTIVTKDRPGLFAELAGVLSAHRMNILSARIATTSDAVAIDSFRVDHGDQPELVIAADRWQRIGQSFKRVLSGEMTAKMLVEKADRPSIVSDSRRLPVVRPRVRVDNEGSVEYTIVDVDASDRIGLLFTIATTLHALGFRVHLAKISTVLDHAADVFYVTDAHRRKVVDESTIDELVRVLEAEIRAGDDEAAA